MFRGRLYKEGQFWLIEVPDLDLTTQGHSKQEAYVMLVDLLKTAANRRGFQPDVTRFRNNTFLLSGRDEPSERDLIAILLRRQRIRAGLSLGDMARLLRAKSRNSYARYEHGEAVPSPLTMSRIMRAMGMNFEIRVRGAEPEEEITAA